jgi:hypothetical protein
MFDVPRLVRQYIPVSMQVAGLRKTNSNRTFSKNAHPLSEWAGAIPPVLVAKVPNCADADLRMVTPSAAMMRFRWSSQSYRFGLYCFARFADW